MTEDRIPIEPILECVVRVSPTERLATFGYENKNDFPVTLERGSEQNTFGIEGSKQPETFKPGKHFKMVSILFEKEVVEWQLDGKKAVCDKDSKGCKLVLDEVQEEKPKLTYRERVMKYKRPRIF